MSTNPLGGRSSSVLAVRMGHATPRLRRLTAAAWRANKGRIKRRLKGHNPKGNKPSRELRRSW